MIGITSTPRNVHAGFDWTSKAMVALYAALATAALMTTGYFVIRGIRRRVRLTSRPLAKAQVTSVEVNPDAGAA